MSKTDKSKQIEALVYSGDPTFQNVYPSLYIDVRSVGVANWVFRYQLRGRRCQFKIGSYGQNHEQLLDYPDAVKVAIDCRQKLNDGIDPKLEMERQSRSKLITFDDCVQKYLAKKREQIRTAFVYERIYDNEIKDHLGYVRMEQINSYDIDNVIQRILDTGRPAVANQALLLIKRVFRVAIKYSVIVSNIAQEFSQTEDAGGADKKRQRFLEEHEIEAAFRVFRENPVKITQSSYIALSLLLMLGTRKMELLSAKWTQVDIKRQTFKLFASSTKTDAALVIPIPDLAVPLFQDLRVLSGHSEYLFPKRKASQYPHIGPDTLNDAVACLFGISYGKRDRGPNRMEEAGVEHFTLHDLRRTFRTFLSKLGVSREVSEKCMNHSLKGVEKTYDCYGFFPERVKALNKLSEYVAPLLNYKPLVAATVG